MDLRCYFIVFRSILVSGAIRRLNQINLNPKTMGIQSVPQTPQFTVAAQIRLHEPRPRPLLLSLTAPWLENESNEHSYTDFNDPKRPRKCGVHESIGEYYRRTVADIYHIHRSQAGLPTAANLTADLIDRLSQRRSDHVCGRQRYEVERQYEYMRLQTQSIEPERALNYSSILTQTLLENKQTRTVDDMLALGQTINLQSVSNVETQEISEDLNLWQRVTLSLKSLLG